MRLIRGAAGTNDDLNLGILTAAPLFHGLTSTDLARFGEHLRAVKLASGKNLLQLDQFNSEIYILTSGTMRVHIEREQRKSVLLAVLGHGEVFGDISALDGSPASASVTPVERCQLVALPAEVFARCLPEMPRLALNLIRLQAHRMRRLTAHCEALATLDVGARLARQLLLFAEDYGFPAKPQELTVMEPGDADYTGGDEAITIPLRLPQSDLAALCGSSLKQVNRVMTEYQMQRVLSVGRGHRITLIRPDILREGY